MLAGCRKDLAGQTISPNGGRIDCWRLHHNALSAAKKCRPDYWR
jgi:hypothetical protein